MSEQEKPLSEREILNHFSDLLPSPPEMETIEKVADLAFKTGFLSKDANSKEKIEFIIMKGLELGIKPIAALSYFNVIQGKVTANSEFQMMMIRKHYPNAHIDFAEMTDDHCVIIVQRTPNEKAVRFEYTMKDAANAGLTGKQTWKQYPRAMLKARNVSQMARTIFPDAIEGISYTSEEMGAEVDSEGTVIGMTQQAPAHEETASNPKKKKTAPAPKVEQSPIATYTVFSTFESYVLDSNGKTVYPYIFQDCADGKQYQIISTVQFSLNQTVKCSITPRGSQYPDDWVVVPASIVEA